MEWIMVIAGIVMLGSVVLYMLQQIGGLDALNK